MIAWLLHPRFNLRRHLWQSGSLNIMKAAVGNSLIDIRPINWFNSTTALINCPIKLSPWVYVVLITRKSWVVLYMLFRRIYTFKWVSESYCSSTFYFSNLLYWNRPNSPTYYYLKPLMESIAAELRAGRGWPWLASFVYLPIVLARQMASPGNRHWKELK